MNLVVVDGGFMAFTQICKLFNTHINNKCNYFGVNCFLLPVPVI